LMKQPTCRHEDIPPRDGQRDDERVPRSMSEAAGSGSDEARRERRGARGRGLMRRRRQERE
jgi:hypothetical protein